MAGTRSSDAAGSVCLSGSDSAWLSLEADSQIVILDEPTAHLDAVSEETIIGAINAMRAQGRTLIVIAHRSAVLDIADTVIDVTAAAIEEERA